MPNLRYFLYLRGVMSRYFIELAYRGSNYHGWQRQPNASTVQQTLEEAMSTILRCECEVVGCGRTDTGVHSSHYIAHWDYSGQKSTTEASFTYKLNSLLPPDIAVHRIYPCDKHARFDATEREYQYVISRRKDPFMQGYSWQLTHNLNTEAMQEAASTLLLYSDFSAFEKLHSDNKTSICRITKAHWSFEDQRYTFHIAADRFLRGMVRAIVGTLVEVGKGRITVEEFRAIVESGNRANASSAAPPDGLYLSKITY